jgi:hypothetical protein
MKSLANSFFYLVKKNNDKYGLLLSFFIIIFLFFISHYWFFQYLPLTYIGTDGTQYIMMQKLFSLGIQARILFPTFGYVLFIHIIDFFSDSLIAISYTQSAISLFSILFLNYAIYKNINKQFIIWTGIALGAFLSAGSTVTFNTSLFPDSFLSSIYILFSASLIFLIKGKRYFFWISMTSVIAAYAIYVRGTSFFLIPIVLIVSSFLLINKNKKKAIYLSAALVISLLIISIVNFFHPFYQTFSLSFKSRDTVFQSIVNEYYYGARTNEKKTFNIKQSAEIDNYINDIIKLLPDSNVLYQSLYSNSWKEKHEARVKTIRGQIFQIDSISGNLILYNQFYERLYSIDSIVSLDVKNEFENKKNQLKSIIDNNEYFFNTLIQNKNNIRFVGFLKFYSYFYDLSGNGVTPLQYGTILYRYNFLSDSIKFLGMQCYSMLYSEYIENPDLQNVLSKHSAKELFDLHLTDNFNFPKRYKAMQEDNIFKLYDIYCLKIHYKIFQNFFTFLIAMLVFISAIFYLFFVNIRSKTAFIVFCIGLILVGLSMIHALHFVYYRYTYSSSFVYFVFLGMTPALVYMAYIKFKEKPIKELIKFQIPLLLRKKSLK